MMRSPALLLALALAACSNPGPAVVSAAKSPQLLACEAQADQDPALKEARAIAAGRLDWQWQHGPEMEQIRQDAITRCLRGRGLSPRGGVERLR